MERDLKQRTKAFALRVIKLYSALPRREDAKILGNQILKSGTSVGLIIAKLVEQNLTQIS